MSLQTVALVLCSSFCLNANAQASWEPTKSVEFIVPAGTGGGADQMARFLQGVISKHKIMAQPLVATLSPALLPWLRLLKLSMAGWISERRNWVTELLII